MHISCATASTRRSCRSDCRGGVGDCGVCARTGARRPAGGRIVKLYILGICGTFMGGVAALARALGHEVSGCDANIYPPMSDQLAALGIQLDAGYRAEHLDG